MGEPDWIKDLRGFCESKSFQADVSKWPLGTGLYSATITTDANTRLIVRDSDHWEALKRISFWEWRALPGVTGFYHLDGNHAEVAVEDAQLPVPRPSRWSQLPWSFNIGGVILVGPKPEEKKPITIHDPKLRFMIEIGPATKEFLVLAHQATLTPLFEPLHSDTVTMKIRFETHVRDISQSVDKIVNSFLFAFSAANEVPLRVSRTHSLPYPSVLTWHWGGLKVVEEVPPPLVEIEREPFLLFNHAESSGTMPLFQYIAYYHVIEYFFPRFSRRRAISIIKDWIAAHGTSIDNQSHIDRLILSLDKIGAGVYQKDKDKLLNVIRECVTVDELLLFIESNKRVADFFNTDRCPLGAPRLSLKKAFEKAEADDQLLVSMRDRISNIRNRIVHAKALDPREMDDPIYPFSEQANHLANDVQLIRFLAIRVLLHTAKQLEVV